ncbi:MAG: DNA N-6-adenine-methyltransferase [Candidatus Helarchaeota archaeon]
MNNNDNYRTPLKFYNKLNKKYNFNFDPCPFQHDINLWNGLKISWKERNFINPPYSYPLKELFIIKALKESQKKKLCVLLLPVSTSTIIFHNIIQPHAKDIVFVKGRIKFENIERKPCGSPRFDSMLIIFDGRKK